MHSIDNRFVTGPSRILFEGVYVGTFQPGNFTGCGSEGVNGHYSSCFNIDRGVIQGDPLFPCLYLIYAEVLSVMIQENEKIKGMNINNKEVLLSRFAYDTTLCLDGSEESFL